jgi:vacuolar iron transporter family protein
LRHRETHLSGRAGWLRAAVLGSNDAIVSTASLMIGVAASEASTQAIFTAGIAGLFAGAMSMAAGEYVSVSSQRDAERAGEVAAEQQSNPWHAAFASLGAFVVGGLVPLLVALLPWGSAIVPAVFVAVLLALVVTGAVSARFGRSPVAPAVRRNVIGGSVAMVVTYAIGTLVGMAL